MVKTQEALGFFLLIDLGLMLLFWLIHTYMAFFTFQVQDSYQIIVYDKQRGPSFAELDVINMVRFASVLIILYHLIMLNILSKYFKIGLLAAFASVLTTL